MRHKVILILIDGLAWDTAQHGMGYLQALCEAGFASRHRLASALPSLSRPLYECILTGTTPVASGIVHNGVNRLSEQTSLFHLARNAGLVTAAAAYHWISELYNRSPYDACRDRFTDDASLPIQHGVFYHRDDYPDDHLFIDAEALRRRHDPDLLFIHPMNVDDAGHRHGFDSAEYRNAARRSDNLLAHYLPGWLAAGYQILVTSDHGMNRDGTHGGDLPEERLVPLFLIGKAFNHAACETPAQTALCGVAADLLGIAHDKPHHPELIA
jgi:predicted AlkP superfamily pyrophosphatase or phosphodiesterase